MVGAVRRAGLAAVQPSQTPTESSRRIHRWFSGFDPAQDDAVVVVGHQFGDREARGLRIGHALGQRLQSACFGGEEPVRRSGMGLDQCRRAVAEAQSGAGADVATGNRRGRDNRHAQQGLGASGNRAQSGHRRSFRGDHRRRRRATISADVRSTMLSTSSKPSDSTVVRVRYVGTRLRRFGCARIEVAEESGLGRRPANADRAGWPNPWRGSGRSRQVCRG